MALHKTSLTSPQLFLINWSWYSIHFWYNFKEYEHFGVYRLPLVVPVQTFLEPPHVYLLWVCRFVTLYPPCSSPPILTSHLDADILQWLRLSPVKKWYLFYSLLCKQEVSVNKWVSILNYDYFFKQYSCPVKSR